MDYEKAYKAALKTATQWIKDGCTDKERICLESVFPELRESEDERIRKFMCSIIDNLEPKDFVGVKKMNVLAWLEKQKEPHYTKRNALFDKCVANCDPEIMKEVSDEIDSQLKKEQQPAEWSEDYREEDLRTRFAFYTYKNEEDDGVLYLSNVFVEEASRNKGFGTKILAAAEKVAETLGAINIRLKVKQNSPANAWYRKHGYGYMTFEDGYDWLEKTLEYIKPIKSGWSEEDEKKRRNLMSLLANMRGDRITEETYQKYYPWLKSLRPSWKPSEVCYGAKGDPDPAGVWKPSEEQMDVMKEAVFYFGNSWVSHKQDILESLYDDLKKFI